MSNGQLAAFLAFIWPVLTPGRDAKLRKPTRFLHISQTDIFHPNEPKPTCHKEEVRGRPLEFGLGQGRGRGSGLAPGVAAGAGAGGIVGRAETGDGARAQKRIGGVARGETGAGEKEGRN